MELKKIFAVAAAAGISVSLMNLNILSKSVIANVNTAYAVTTTDENGETYTEYSDSSGIKYRVYSDRATVDSAPKTITTANIPKKVHGKSVTRIEDAAFYGCTSLKSVKIPNTVITAGYDGETWGDERTKGVFAGCTSLVSVDIPASLTDIGYYAFDGCTSLKTINVDSENPVYSSSEGVLYKENKICKVCPEGKSTVVNIEKNTTLIDACAFENCKEVTAVYIPVNVTEIRWGAFANCDKLNDIYFEGTEEQWEKIQFTADYGGGYTYQEYSQYSDTAESAKNYVYGIAFYDEQYNSTYNYNQKTSYYTRLHVNFNSSPQTVPEEPTVEPTNPDNPSTPTDPTTPSNPTNPNLESIYGIQIDRSASDPDGNKVIDSSDATMILIDYANALLSGDSARKLTKEQADSNGDGTVDSADATNILIFYANELLNQKN